MTCNDCFHKNNNSCPWRGLYEDTDYAEDCMDFAELKGTYESEETDENNSQ